MDNVSLKYFETQPKATTKQLWWHDTLAFMDVELIHKPCKYNVVPFVNFAPISTLCNSQ
jgi:hypothetical protein